MPIEISDAVAYHFVGLVLVITCVMPQFSGVPLTTRQPAEVMS